MGQLEAYGIHEIYLSGLFTGLFLNYWSEENESDMFECFKSYFYSANFANTKIIDNFSNWQDLSNIDFNVDEHVLKLQQKFLFINATVFLTIKDIYWLDDNIFFEYFKDENLDFFSLYNCTFCIFFVSMFVISIIYAVFYQNIILEHNNPAFFIHNTFVLVINSVSSASFISNGYEKESSLENALAAYENSYYKLLNYCNEKLISLKEEEDDNNDLTFDLSTANYSYTELNDNNKVLLPLEHFNKENEEKKSPTSTLAGKVTQLSGDAYKKTTQQVADINLKSPITGVPGVPYIAANAQSFTRFGKKTVKVGVVTGALGAAFTLGVAVGIRFNTKVEPASVPPTLKGASISFETAIKSDTTDIARAEVVQILPKYIPFKETVASAAVEKATTTLSVVSETTIEPTPVAKIVGFKEGQGAFEKRYSQTQITSIDAANKILETKRIKRT